jgi:rhodanese-related sulfurtransferase
MATFSEVTVEKAKELLADRTMLVLDKRDIHSYKQGHIDGAMLAHDGLIETLIKKREVDKPVLVYCYRGNDSKELANMMAGFGFKEVYSMAGGYAEWKRCDA